MLLLLLCLLPAARSLETSTSVFFKAINQSCPDPGYFFERGKGPKAPCYLCFCKADGVAVCSLRADTRCDQRLYSHPTSEPKMRKTPVKADIFGDSTKDLLNTNKQQECKPNSSKSVGCPPPDWCQGCMLCDCDANGHWNCHLLKHCDKKTKKSKKALKNNKNPSNVRYVRNNTVKIESKRSKNVDMKRSGKRMKKYMNDPNAMPKISVETKKSFHKDKIVLKKYISTLSPIKSPDLLKYKNNPSKLAQLLFKQYMSNMKKAPNKIKKRTITDKSYGAKMANMKRLVKRNSKPNKMKSEKSMNTNKNKHKNTTKVMKNKKKDGNKKELKKSTAFKSRKYFISKYNNTSKRAKRDVSVAKDIPKNVTNLEVIKTTNDSGYTHQFTNGTEVSFTTSEDIHTNLNNYAYTVDKPVTASMNSNKSNASQYDTTEREENNTNKKKNTIAIDTTNSTTSNGVERKTATEKMQADTTDRGLKLITVHNDVLSNTKLMNDSNYEQIVTIENATSNFVTNQSEINEIVKVKVSAQDIKKITLAKKKFDLKKLVRTLHSRIGYTKNIGDFKNKSLIDNNSTRVKINGTLNDIQRLLEKMLRGATKNKKTNDRLKTKSFAAIKYLKTLFSKLFSISKNKTAVEKVAVLNSICETFGPCRISNKKMKTINFKVKQLISETLKALNSIRTIKELLKRLNDHNDKKENNTSKETDFKIHLKHLNAILKDEYSPNKIKWTPAQIALMNHIKLNTQVFVKSISKFATILNDVISIIKSENEKFNLKQNAMISKKKKIKETEVISKMKRLLLKYNLIQNTFLHKMYAALSNVEDRVKNKSSKEFRYKNNTENNTNYKIIIEKYVDNIDENLKKLKELAARMDSKTRRKRDARDDNAVDYLLTLMEYLLKNNNPIDTPPVKDGIDLLIEAIRRGPDIRPIQKPVLQYEPIEAAGPANSAVSREESDSKSKENANKSEESANNDVEYNARKKYNKPIVTLTAKNTQEFIDLSDVVTEFPSKVYMVSYNPEKPDNETASIKGARKNEDTDTLIVDDDTMKMIEKAEVDMEADAETPATTVHIFKEQTVEGHRHNVPITKEYATEEPKTKLDLINEAYEQEIKQAKEQKQLKQQKKKTTVRPIVNRVKGETGTREEKTGNADISSITKEIVDEEKVPIDTDKIISRKQMELLNSLDYGTDKSLLDDSDSKDDSPVERFNEAFSTF